MSVNIQISKEVHGKLEEIAKNIESLTGKRPSIEQVLVALIEVYTKSANVDPSRIDMLIDVWGRLDSLEKRIEKLEKESSSQQVQEQPVKATQIEAAKKSKQESGTPVVAVPTKPVTQKQETQKGQEQPKDRFLEFMQNVFVYPLDKLRKPRDQIEKLVKEKQIEIMTVNGQELVVYRPAIDQLLKKLPIPLSEKQKLEPKERRLLDTLRDAGIVVEDAVSGKIREV
ncbi:hypothetical protein B9Q13_05180 [Candidatus Marsarchaeota G2 archaeon ECH_B_SAG-G16]|jgi:hypothetical protein|uniref:Uncharacterized protein n=5 Tax=Candidatus Marsarchaeota TaxID=1978152 RepID=A0A2R6AJM1_9ARCH|nr:MAG: hypothetical protein B9Q01_00210 [Candidatus Marsarchaeota G1 archaeon OSP_D]PSN86571.1 MAG: hypothetical protein B9Q02_01725 [Candidatus Marsarchaeota G1 archaeon BE_D]PSN87625.1 MAG: hypothetical protein B9P99_06375 [Candidatus Marsarchaeota G1 archaeon OSP_B]PSN89677.1 MAG: hypothetical protein B9Q00_00220 [Candidatus Marsarchaeota G1 archaeon OSP_C]PSO04278.1 MAG: hypothetical protein B9Q13_05180 [Candidatus Marsarchaeota G2 archaeon ECH_B_SAG-G16]